MILGFELSDMAEFYFPRIWVCGGFDGQQSLSLRREAVTAAEMKFETRVPSCTQRLTTTPNADFASLGPSHPSSSIECFDPHRGIWRRLSR